MGNPNPNLITDATWWLWERLHALEPSTQLGGIYANKSGYHNTRSANQRSWPGNYSARDAEDLTGPDKASALDWTFPEAQRGDYGRISKYAGRLLASGRDMDDPRLNGLREFYGNADWDLEVEGWDARYLRTASSDSSHLWHIHFSFDRSLSDDMDNMRAILSVVAGETVTQWRGQAPVPPVPVPAPRPPGLPAQPPGTRDLRRGSRGTDVAFVQKYIGPAHCGPADGDYGPTTEAGVRWYASIRGVPYSRTDGVVDRWTWGQMGIRVSY